MNHKASTSSVEGQDKQGAYGAQAARGGDTDFRRKWNKEEYAAKAHEREAREKKEAKERYEEKLTGKKKFIPEDPEAKAISARSRTDFSEVIGKNYLVPLGASVGRKGKGAGFYCDACDETYKDNNSWLEHINSKSHLRKTGQKYEQERASLDECIARLELLKEKKAEKERQSQYDIEHSIAQYSKKEEEERKRRREEKKARLSERRKEDIEKSKIKVEGSDQEDEQISLMMGFGGFK